MLDEFHECHQTKCTTIPEQSAAGAPEYVGFWLDADALQLPGAFAYASAKVTSIWCNCAASYASRGEM
uniref:Uncharacterized protein n=1 Tax=Anopheles quadriannulatus TaxID=34691 RepID=A0A182X0Y8_ANOQN